jgi:hypothetical protein
MIARQTCLLKKSCGSGNSEANTQSRLLPRLHQSFKVGPHRERTSAMLLKSRRRTTTRSRMPGKPLCGPWDQVVTLRHPLIPTTPLLTNMTWAHPTHPTVVMHRTRPRVVGLHLLIGTATDHQRFRNKLRLAPPVPVETTQYSIFCIGVSAWDCTDMVQITHFAMSGDTFLLITTGFPVFPGQPCVLGVSMHQLAWTLRLRLHMGDTDWASGGFLHIPRPFTASATAFEGITFAIYDLGIHLVARMGFAEAALCKDEMMEAARRHRRRQRSIVVGLGDVGIGFESR